MITLKEAFKNLTQEQHEQLMYAFEQEFEQIVELDDGLVLGVNVIRDDILVLESNNNWTLGKLKKEKMI